ncbi:MAG: hypothetical protein SGILL_005128, partial [Bacillariaceae sp.]
MERPPPPPTAPCSAAASKPKTKSSLKRSRPVAVKSDITSPNAHVENGGGSSDNAQQPIVVLTPHTLRLLKLVQEGSVDHARLAATHLEELSRPANNQAENDSTDSDDDASQSSQSSPLVLWELLGRLQGYLGATDWSTRSNAGLAMEGVARNLPLDDQTAFLQEDLTASGTKQSSSSSSSWLRLHDVQDNLTTILEQGRWLLANAESKYQVEREEQVLKRLTAKTAAHNNGASSSETDKEELRDFCARR